MLFALTPQAEQAISAAGDLAGPAGIIIAVLVASIVGYLTYRNRTLEKRETELVDDRQAVTEEYAADLRDLERKVRDVLRDVLNVMDNLEASDKRAEAKIKDLHGSVREVLQYLKSQDHDAT